MNIFDILILGLIFLGALQGYRKGLISGLVSLVGNVLGFYIAIKEYLNVLKWLDLHTPLRSWLEPVVYRFVLPSVQSQAQTTQQQALDRVLSLIPKELLGLFGSGSAPDLNAYTQNVIQALAKNLSGILTEDLMRMISFFLTYFLIILILQVLVAIVLSPIGFFTGTVNRGGGFLLGALGALVGISVFVGLLAPFLPFIGQNGNFALLQEAKLYPYLVQVFDMLKQAFHFEMTQGLTNPLDLTKGILK